MVSASEDDAVFWQPQPFTLEHHLDGVERALEIVVLPRIAVTLGK
jgi:SecY interacting protein Syd